MEKKSENKIENKKSNLTLENRKRIILSGVIEVISFDEETIEFVTSVGNLTISGNELKMNKLDVQNGDVIITGNVDSIIYGKENKKNKESIIKRLFR
ncbi:sporulation protein YabP [Clostridium sp. BJN0001]|uniref:sporulation protein YabP n=1 Tax=Clostridium sp. BJN0001 TaxID=2930219 RepID=UPI001FD2667E|nr:sporulation protein YabP [Clostridium sp. BJN0001]